MKKNIIKYLLLIVGVIILIIIYLSVVGLETDKFNKQIKDKIFQTNSELDLKLKKIKLTLDPLNFKFNAKTIGTKVIYRGKKIELEYIKTQISLISLIKNKLVSSNLKISTRSILLRDLVTFIRVTSNRPELFILEKVIKKGHVIVNVKLNFDENGKVKKDYEISGLLKNGQIKLLKNSNFEKINFRFNIKNNILNFKDINISTNKIDLFSDNLKVTQTKKDFLFEGEVQNKKSILNNELFNLIKLNFKNFNFVNTNFSSKNIFSFNIDNKFKLKNLVIESEIDISESEYKKFVLLNNYFPGVKDIIYLKDHKIKAKYRKNNFSFNGSGKIKLQKKFDEIEYFFTKKESDFNIVSKILLSELNIKNQAFNKKFFPKINKKLNLKDHKININYKKNNLSIKGSGKIQLENNKLDEIDYSVSANGKKLNFDTRLDLDKTLFKIDSLNYKKNVKSKTELKVIGSYEKNNYLNFDEISILAKDNKILLKNLALNKNNKILKIDKLDLNYFDIENKKNQLIVKKIKNNNYILNGSIFNANSLIFDLLKSKSDNQFKILKSNINLDINLSEVFLDDKDIINNLKGKIYIEDNRVVEANISALFKDDENLNFTINFNNGEKITTLFSSKAKPLVKRYKFIKGFEEGYLDFYSSKKDKISNSRLKIYDFKLRQMPILTKLLTLASLQGIADILSGEGIRFDELEMNFNNKDNLITIDEIYAIGPAISILMSGYVEEGKLISLRGTLVPATTINKTISTIPILGKILVGSKTGEGVFGVSFKIKGSPKNLETTVNPIKTLTPRFITRTLEKIKKN